MFFRNSTNTTLYHTTCPGTKYTSPRSYIIIIYFAFKQISILLLFLSFSPPNKRFSLCFYYFQDVLWRFLKKYQFFSRFLISTVNIYIFLSRIQINTVSDIFRQIYLYYSSTSPLHSTRHLYKSFLSYYYRFWTFFRWKQRFLCCFALFFQCFFTILSFKQSKTTPNSAKRKV